MIGLLKDADGPGDASNRGAGRGALVTVGGPEGVGGGPLLVSGGGSTKVATGELFAESAVLRTAEGDADDWLRQVRRIRSLAPDLDSGMEGGDFELRTADREIREIQDRLADLAGRLDAAAENYGAAEREVERLFRSLGADVAWLLGASSPVWLVPAVIPTIAATAIGCVLASMITGTPLTELPAEVAKWIAEHPEIYTNPAFVQLVGVLVASVDDAVEGRLGVPHWLTRLLGDDQLEVFGASASVAGGLYLLRSTGVGSSTPITVKTVGELKPVQPPRGYDDAVSRIPRSVLGIPQILIEQYPGPDGPVWYVYVGGTVDWSMAPEGEPFDMSSNLQAVGQVASGSREAVEAAMRKAGIQPGDTVQAFGHSQGGLVLAQVAAAGASGINGVTTFGSPSGQVPVTVSTMAFEHLDDLVVSLGGTSADQSDQRLVVERQAYLNRDIPAGEILPAHQMEAYADSAALADASEDPRVTAQKAATFDVGVGAGVAVSWRADRAQPRRGGGRGEF